MKLRHLLATSAIALAATTGTLTAATPASAYHIYNLAQNPGRVTGQQIQGSHYNTCAPLGTTCWSAWILAAGPVVFRSPATTSKQMIVVRYVLQRWNGSAWVNQASTDHVRYLASGYGRIQMPPVNFLPTSAGHFQLSIVVGWYSPDGTRSYGGKALVFDQAGDYVCNTRFPCQVGDGWVWLRAPGV